MVRVRMPLVAVNLSLCLLWLHLAAGDCMADQIKWQGARPTMTFQTKSSPDLGSKRGGPPPCPLPPTPMHIHTHKLICFLYFRHIEAIACKTTNRSIHINSHKEGAMCMCAVDKERFSMWHWPWVHPIEAA